MSTSASTRTFVVYGAGGFAREVAWLIESCSNDSTRHQVVSFVSDNESEHGSRLNDIPVMSLTDARERVRDAHMVAAIGDPSSRQAAMERAEAMGFRSDVVVHPRVERSGWVEIGDGTVICAGNILTTNIRIGRHVQINLDCTVGHDVIMGDYTTLAPGVHVSGWVHFSERVYVGTGAVIINGTKA